MTDSKTILLVEDNQQLNAINRRALQRAGYRVLTALSLREAEKHLQNYAPDAIILDIMLPDGNGVEFCRKIRQHIAAPILFLTSVSGYEQTLAGLAAGGDDYLHKPFDLDMLLAKVAAFLRRDEIAGRVRTPDRSVVRGALVLDTVAAQAFLEGKDMLLSPKEFALLLLLVRREGETLSAETIYMDVWKQPLFGNTNSLKVAMSRLRKKLDRSDLQITSVRGEGYRFEML